MTQLLLPDILADARGLSCGISGLGIAIGLFLWVTGWWFHRFWIVLGTTFLAGIFGLLSSSGHHLQPLMIALLLAVASGVLALSLVRVVAFAASGAAACAVAHAAVKTFDEPLICFLAGGLVGLVLFRFWIMAATSFLGSMLVAYSGLCLADRLGTLNAVDWANEKQSLLTWGVVGLTVLGLGAQFGVERLRRRFGGGQEPEIDPQLFIGRIRRAA